MCAFSPICRRKNNYLQNYQAQEHPYPIVSLRWLIFFFCKPMPFACESKITCREHDSSGGRLAQGLSQLFNVCTQKMREDLVSNVT